MSRLGTVVKHIESDTGVGFFICSFVDKLVGKIHRVIPSIIVVIEANGQSEYGSAFLVNLHLDFFGGRRTYVDSSRLWAIGRSSDEIIDDGGTCQHVSLPGLL